MRYSFEAKLVNGSTVKADGFTTQKDAVRWISKVYGERVVSYETFRVC